MEKTLDYNNYFSQHLAKMLSERKLTQLELAKRAGISISFVSDILSGKGNPSLKIMAAIAVALDVPLPIMLMDPDGELFKLVNYFQNSLYNEQKAENKNTENSV